MLLEINPHNIDGRKISEVVQHLRKNGIIIFPTDTVYSLGCSLHSPKGIKELARLKGIKPKQANFSLVCKDLSTLSEYTKQVNRSVYRIMNHALPGPFTFILNASNSIPRLFDSSKKTVGIRIPDNEIARAIVEELGHPLVVTSVHDKDEILEYTTDPYQIFERFEKSVDLIIDGGYGKNEASTVVDCTKDGVEIVRQGAGQIEDLL